MVQRLLTEEGNAKKKLAPKAPSLLHSSTFNLPIQRDTLDIAKMPPSQVLSLQRSIGNREVQRLISQRGAPPIQAKLEVGPVEDKYEKEADHIANEVVSSPSTPQSSVQRSGLHKESVQMKPDWIQRHKVIEEEGEEEEAEDYEPSPKEISKEVGIAKRLGLHALMRGAKVGDFAMNMFRKNKKTPLTTRAEDTVIGTYTNARNRLYQKDRMRGMSWKERRQYKRQEREERRRLDEEFEEYLNNRVAMVNF